MSNSAASDRASRSNDNVTDDVTHFFDVLSHERAALQLVEERFLLQTAAIASACRLLRRDVTLTNSRARVVVSGVGKAGLIASKIAATMASLGCSAHFLHPVESLHGDLGAVVPEDCALLLSYSDETIETVRLARELVRLRCPLIAITRSCESQLGKLATVCLETGRIAEACHLGLAPSSSTTAMLAIGDALALAVARTNGLSKEEFALNHPAGTLALQFRRVEEFVRTGSRLVCLPEGTTVQDAAMAVSHAKTGCAIIVDADNRLIGIFTDGDLRRALLQGNESLTMEIAKFASIPCRCVDAEASVVDAIQLFRETRVEELPAIDNRSGEVVGVLCLKDIAIL
jgi:arabinose-5-phosphate isomerase